MLPINNAADLDVYLRLGLPLLDYKDSFNIFEKYFGASEYPCRA